MAPGKTLTAKVKGKNPAKKAHRLKVQAGNLYTITHYTFALEDDPSYAEDEFVEAKGLKEKHRKGFLFGKSGVIMQGTGMTSDKQYITVDWSKGRPSGTKTVFKYGIGGAHSTPEAWHTVATDPSQIKLGSKLEIEIHKDKGLFTAADTGQRIKGRHIDVFVGPVTLQEARMLGTKKSKVTVK